MAIRQFEARGGDWSFRIATTGATADRADPAGVAGGGRGPSFANHNGFDLKPIEHARKRNEEGMRRQHRISQQLAKNLFLAGPQRAVALAGASGIDTGTRS